MASKGTGTHTSVVGKADHYRALCDFAKHIATLSLGSLILVGTLLDKLPGRDASKGIMGFAMVALLFSMVASALAFLVTAVRFPQADKPPLSFSERNLMALAVVSSFIGFVMGVGLIAYDVWANT
ncbi:hypothetical protein SAMN05216289_11361 [Dokdonella immobilis]|uniref:Uncharacterized protein n=1 Tax=Dokdonella immobilis TaxID=578942 RepID=A0A1I4XZ50_9GAMM|nr:hypothetical protein SAMN05216289_11361 [Dokdonella immobilis]